MISAHLPLLIYVSQILALAKLTSPLGLQHNYFNLYCKCAGTFQLPRNDNQFRCG
jgi:hypothetical protein